MRVTFLRLEFPTHIIQKFIAILCAIVLVPGDVNLLAQSSAGGGPHAGEEVSRIPPETARLSGCSDRAFILTHF